jgi:serine/threonine-protein kinase
VSETGEVLPRRLGSYRLLRRVGSGGMGSVYLAVRADGQFQRRVAVKLIKRGMDTEEVLRRFERERQVLAGLDHPNIARLLDGGMSEDGRPYLVLEFVEGEPLDRWCDSQGSSPEERIELFLQICEAVDAAHRSHVVHRDL